MGKDGRTSLEHRTKSDRAYWELGLFREAAEAVGAYHSAASRVSRRWRSLEPTDSAEDAARRARGQVRRYCAANRLNKLGTLTYGAACHDPARLRADLAACFRRLRSTVGEPFPYLWVPEWHAGGHGLHAHFAVARWIHYSLIRAAWGQGFVHIKLLGDLPVDSGVLGESRMAARYLSKYVSKDLDASMAGLHRYDVARGFQPERLALTGTSADDVLGQATAVMGREPARVWRSSDMERWERPAAVWAQWND